MLHVELEVPGLSFDSAELMVDESTTVSQAIEDFINIIRQLRPVEIGATPTEFMLCDVSEGRVLLHDRTMADCKIKSGSRLMLV